MDIFEKYPEIAAVFEKFCQTRRNEILQDMVKNDNKYNSLRRVRTSKSMLLRDILHDKYMILEEYSEAVFEQECYELDKIYRQSFLDALKVLNKYNLLK